MSKIVLEDFNEGGGFYKVNLAYLNKEQVEEIEAIVSKWNLTDEDMKDCIGMCLTDVDEQRFRDYNTNLRDCLDWLEKQSESDETKVKMFLINKGYPIDTNGIFPTYEEMYNIIKEGLEKQGEQKPNPYSGTSFEYNGHTWGMCARDGGAEVSMDGNLKAFISSDASFIYPDIPQPNLAPKSALEEFKEEKVNNANKVEQKLANSAKTCKKPQRLISAEAKEALYDRPAWTEEDDEMLDGIILRCEKYGHQEQINWLKSLKERIGG